jgi:hypothetical protein
MLRLVVLTFELRKHESSASLVPRPYFNLVGSGVRNCVNCMGVVMEMDNIPPGESNQVEGLGTRLSSASPFTTLLVM